MLPVIKAAKERSNEIETTVINTGQHKEMCNAVMQYFSIEPDIDFAIMKQNQTLSSVTATVLEKATNVFTERRPDFVLVHGDTTTAFLVSLACFYLKNSSRSCRSRPENTADLQSPFPEEMNRTFIDMVSDYFFAPTEKNQQNLP